MERSTDRASKRQKPNVFSKVDVLNLQTRISSLRFDKDQEVPTVNEHDSWVRSFIRDLPAGIGLIGNQEEEEAYHNR